MAADEPDKDLIPTSSLFITMVTIEQAGSTIQNNCMQVCTGLQAQGRAARLRESLYSICTLIDCCIHLFRRGHRMGHVWN